MAKISTRRGNGTLSITVVPSLDHLEEPAVVLCRGIPLRIHASNGGYLFSLVVDENGHVIQFQDTKFYGGLHEQKQYFAHTLV